MLVLVLDLENPLLKVSSIVVSIKFGMDLNVCRSNTAFLKTLDIRKLNIQGMETETTKYF